MYHFLLSRMMNRFVTSCLALSIIAVSAVQATNIPFNPAEFGQYFNYDKALQNNGPLEKVVKLLATGRRDEAKMLLARILTRNPRDARALGLAGMLLLEDKKYTAAEASFRRALAMHPTNAGLLSKLGVSLLLQGKLNLGETKLRKTLARDKEESLALRYMGWLAQTRGNLDKASEYYFRFIQSRGVHAKDLSRIHLQLAIINNDAARYQDTVKLVSQLLDKKLPNNLQRTLAIYLIEAYAELKEVKQARKWLQRLEAHHKGVNQAELLMLKARILRQDNRQNQAIDLLRKAIKSDSAYEGVIRYLLAQTYTMSGNKRQAFKELDELSRLLDKDNLVKVINQMAALKLDMKDQQGAIKLLKDMVDKYPDIPHIKFQLAELLMVVNHLPQAREAASQIVRTHPSFIPAYLLAGRLERAYKNTDKAETLLKKAISLYSGYYEAWVELAGIYVDEKKYDKAINVLEQALKLNPGHTILMFEIASIYQETGKISSADVAYRKILKVDPDNIRSLTNLALNLLESPGGQKEALSLVKRAYDNSDHPVIVDTYAWALVNNDKAHSAIALLRKIIKTNPDNASVNYHMGIAMIKAGQSKDGRAYLQKALSLGVDPVTKERIQAHLMR